MNVTQPSKHIQFILKKQACKIQQQLQQQQQQQIENCEKIIIINKDLKRHQQQAK